MSCYKIAPGANPNSFVFPTDKGWFYSISFISKSGFFKGYEVLENNGLFFEIIIERTPLVDPAPERDPMVEKTIRTTLANQFQEEEKLAIYFFWCDMHDRQEAARARLFHKWHQLSALPGWDLINFELSDQDTDELTYFGGLFVHIDHPHYLQIEEAFVHLLRHDISSGKLVSWF